MKIPFTKPYFDDEEEKLVVEAIRSGWVTQGPKIRDFENAVSAYIEVPHVVAVNSCASALHLAMIIAGIGEGDEVICPSYTFIATPNCIEYVNARPVFAEVDSDTSNIDPDKIEEHITPKTKAIITVHQNGMACDIDAVAEVANRHGLLVIEDAAYGMGALYKGKRIGGHSPMSCFSFHPRKTMTTGEGGIFAAASEQHAGLARSLRAHGASIPVEVRENAKGILYEEYTHVGYNYKMTDLQAAMGIAQLKKLDQVISRRQMRAGRYREELKSCSSIIMPKVPDGYTHTYGSFQIVLADGTRERRDKLIQLLAESDVPSRRGIPACHEEPLYLNKYGKISLPVTEKLSAASLFLPMYPQMTDEEQDFIISQLRTQITNL